MLDLEKRVIGKVMRRLIPFLILCYFVAYLDRVKPALRRCKRASIETRIRCATRLARTSQSTRTRRRSEQSIPLVAFCLRHFLADFIICMCEFDFRQAQASCLAVLPQQV
jgi:hypothetical protein